MWREGEGKPAPGPNHQIWGFVMGIGAKCAGPRGMTSRAGLPGGRKPAWSGQLIPPAVRPVQELGTIEARACLEVARACRAARSPPRSNSIRRSNAVDRIIG